VLDQFFFMLHECKKEKAHLIPYLKAPQQTDRMSYRDATMIEQHIYIRCTYIALGDSFMHLLAFELLVLRLQLGKVAAHGCTVCKKIDRARSNQGVD